VRSSVAFSGPRLSVDVLARPRCIPFVSNLARTFLVESAGLDERASVTSQVRIAIVEVVTNVVRHGYRNRTAGPLSVELEVQEGWLTVHVRDRGRPFDSTRAAALPAPEHLAEGGYGLGIVQTVMDELAYDWSADGGNHVTMRKRIPPRPRGESS
jgi:anti-sigma regulatory factor (Ser/Thr protein kinase)